MLLTLARSSPTIVPGRHYIRIALVRILRINPIAAWIIDLKGEKGKHTPQLRGIRTDIHAYRRADVDCNDSYNVHMNSARIRLRR